MLIRLTALLSAAFIAFGPGAEAQTLIGEILCGSQQEMRAKLTRQFDVERAGSGLRGHEAMLEIWTNPHTGDWTLIQSYADGRMCLLAMGENWEMRAADPAPTFRVKD